jgi:hypothetical protein|tara:strand:+ start:60 stop:236 length:177 start_codon:yes stop_codon:yes gene_type:complete
MKISIARLKEIIMEEVAKAASVETTLRRARPKEPPVKEDLYPETNLEESLHIEIVDDE